jgi:hypothetical protein
LAQTSSNILAGVGGGLLSRLFEIATEAFRIPRADCIEGLVVMTYAQNGNRVGSGSARGVGLHVFLP